MIADERLAELAGAAMALQGAVQGLRGVVTASDGWPPDGGGYSELAERVLLELTNAETSLQRIRDAIAAELERRVTP